MKLIRLILLLSLVLFQGCLGPKSPKQTANEYIRGWAISDMFLPSDEVPFFRENFEEVSQELISALTNPNKDTRVRAAYVIGELGVNADSTEIEIRNAIITEKSRYVRMYLYSAIQSFESVEDESIQLLRKKFDELRDDPGTKLAEYYAGEDEAISLAEALYILDSNNQRKDGYLKYVSQWLEKPSLDLNEQDLNEYWEHRWCSVISLEDMKGAERVIPKLEAMLLEEAKKPWVSIHVPRVIQSLLANESNHD